MFPVIWLDTVLQGFIIAYQPDVPEVVWVTVTLNPLPEILMLELDDQVIGVPVETPLIVFLNTTSDFMQNQYCLQLIVK